MFLRIDAEPSIRSCWLGQCINVQSVRLLNLEIKKTEIALLSTTWPVMWYDVFWVRRRLLGPWPMRGKNSHPWTCFMCCTHEHVGLTRPRPLILIVCSNCIKGDAWIVTFEDVVRYILRMYACSYILAIWSQNIQIFWANSLVSLPFSLPPKSVNTSPSQQFDCCIN